MSYTEVQRLACRSPQPVSYMQTHANTSNGVRIIVPHPAHRGDTEASADERFHRSQKIGCCSCTEDSQGKASKAKKHKCSNRRCTSAHPTAWEFTKPRVVSNNPTQRRERRGADPNVSRSMGAHVEQFGRVAHPTEGEAVKHPKRVTLKKRHVELPSAASPRFAFPEAQKPGAEVPPRCEPSTQALACHGHEAY